VRERETDGPVEEVAADAASAAAAALLPTGGSLTPHALLGVQRAAGNRAAAALVARLPVGAVEQKLAPGSTGPDVLDLQMHLNQLDEVKTPLDVDSIYGPITARAVREFQSAHPPLRASGAADAGTRAAIAEALTEEQDATDVARKLFLLGATNYDRRKFGHAYAFFTRAAELADRPSLTFSRAQALRRLGGRRQEAIALYEEYLASGQADRAAEAEEALAELRTPAATGDEDVDNAVAKGIFLKGAALYERGDYAHAYDEFTRAGELSDRPSLWFSRAQALRRLGGHREEAIALYEQYIATGGDRTAEAEAAVAGLRAPAATGDEAVDSAAAKEIFLHGAALYEKGDYAHAYDEFTRAGEVSARPSLLFSRAQALRRLGGREDEAKALYEQYLATGGDRADDAEQMLELLRTHGAGPR